MTQQIVRAACPHDCPDTCALLVTVADGRVRKVQGDPAHPPTGGVLCTKVSRYPERLYHPLRLLYPMKRVGRKGEGHFARITWEEAFDTVARRLGAIAAVDPQRILPYNYAGTMGLVQGDSLSARFFNRLGASQLEKTICAAAGAAALKYTYGASVGTDPDHAHEARLILIWGSNSVTSNLHFWTRAQAAKRGGARLVAIDPYRTATAEHCDEHLALRPGTDAALALGLMHVLIREDLLDHAYIADHTLGFEALRERAADFPPARVAEICGIPAAQVEDLAQLMGDTAVRQRQPVLIRLNYGLQRTYGGGQATRAIACLPGLIGAWRHRAGGALMSTSGFFPVDDAALTRPDLRSPLSRRRINMSTIGDALLHPGDERFGPPIEALVVYNSNPVAVAPESARVAAGFAREDLFTVVLEHFQTDTADYADILLPATMQMEHLDVHKAYGHTYFVANLPAVSAPGEARPNTAIFRELARRLGFTEPCLADSDEDLARQAIAVGDPRAAGITWERLREAGWAKLAVPEAPFAAGGFPTPSGRCEFHSAALAATGGDPLPTYLPPRESAAANPALAARYPLTMLSPPARNFLNTTFVNVDSLRAREGAPRVEIHPDDAAARRIADGEVVRVFNDRGSLRLTARVDARTRPGVVVVPSIWWKKFADGGKNANELTSQALTDLGGAPTFYDCLVEVERMAEAS